MTQPCAPTSSHIIGIILAGGASARMGGDDKGALQMGGRRIVDHVVQKMLPQTCEILFAGPHAYETGRAHLADLTEGPIGPVAGVFAAWRWLRRERPDIDRFMTVPVDGPFVPDDLAGRLQEKGGCAIAMDDAGLHPTFALWTMQALAHAWQEMDTGAAPSLRYLAKLCAARRVRWPGERAFFNVNTLQDLAEARAHFAQNCGAE